VFCLYAPCVSTFGDPFSSYLTLALPIRQSRSSENLTEKNSLVDRHVGIGGNGTDEDGFLVGRQGHVLILVEGLDQTSDQLVRGTDGQW